MSYHGHFQNEKPKKKKRGLKIFLIILAVLLVLVAAIGIGAKLYLDNMFSKVNYVEMPDMSTPAETTEAPATTEATAATTEATEATTEATTVETTVPPMTAEDIINILVVGQAARAGEETHMADTTILVSVNTYTKTITLSSVLRDTYVDFPDYKTRTCGWGKMTTAYNLGYSWEGIGGAMAYSNLTMKQNFGVEVDYNVEIDFEGFIKIIDFIGGVQLELTEAEAKYLNEDDLYVKYDVEPGLQTLDGMAALSYARMRKAEGDSESDIKRTSRQRYLLETLVARYRNASLSELQKAADILLPLITTNMDSEAITNVLLKVLPMISEVKIESGTIPVEGTYWGEMVDIYEDGMMHSVLKFDQGQNKKLIRAITEAEVTE